MWIKRGICSGDSLINLLLCCLGYIPGLIHAWYIIAQFPDNDYEAIGDEERVTYYYVSRDGVAPPGAGGVGAGAGPAGAPPGVAGQPDGGRAHRELQRGGSAYGTLNAGRDGRARSGSGAAQNGQESGSTEATPPSYADAVKGDNKVQVP